MDKPPAEEPVRGKQGLVHMLKSVFAAIFGIQSDKNRQEDFKKGDASQYITLGIVVVVGIILTMLIVVNSVLETAAK